MIGLAVFVVIYGALALASACVLFQAARIRDYECLAPGLALVALLLAALAVLVGV